MKVVCFEQVVKRYSENEIALNGVSVAIEDGEFAALAGPSGSGKTTMLNISAGLDVPSEGRVLLLDKDIQKLSPNELSLLRRGSVGFVFQSYNLFPVLTALENVEYLLALNGVHPKERRAIAEKALESVGLVNLGNRMPNQLSGGQQQRVAIARAIVTHPKVVFADEPTANLDSKTATHLLALFRQLNEERGITFIFSSHDPLVLTSAKRIIEIADGRIKSDSAENAKPLQTTQSRLSVAVDPSLHRPTRVCEKRDE